MSRRCCRSSTCSSGCQGSLAMNVGTDALGHEQMSAWVGSDRKQLESLELNMHMCGHVRYKQHAHGVLLDEIFLYSCGLKP